MSAPRLLRVISVELFERPVELRLPFRFGAVTVTACPQAFVRAAIELDDGRRAHGAAAEMMIPKWFDKSAHRSNAENIDDLRDALRRAANAYTSSGTPRTAFGHFASHYVAAHERRRPVRRQRADRRTSAPRCSTAPCSMRCAARWEHRSLTPCAPTRPASTHR